MAASLNSFVKSISETQLKIRIRPPPQKRNPRRPILPVDRLPRPRMILPRQNPRRRCELRTRNFSANGAWGHARPRIVPNPLRLPHVAARHHVKFPIFLAKPHGSSDSHAGFAKRCQGNIFLTLNCWGDLARHRLHSKLAERKSRPSNPFSGGHPVVSGTEPAGDDCSGHV